MMYRVEFQFTYGGTYFSETFTDLRDVANFHHDIDAVEGIRPLFVEVSEDGECWMLYQDVLPVV